MSKINVSTITNRTGTSGPVLSGVTTATNGFNVTGGNVGIGTDNPNAALSVLSTAYPTVTITRDHPSNYPRLRIANTSIDGADLDGLGSGGGFRIACVAAGVSTERVRVSSNGDVGIGEDDPGARLEVSGGQNQTANTFVDLLRISANANNDGAAAEMQLNFGISASHTNTANRRARIQAITEGGTARELSINPDGGYVGIATDDPGHPFEIHSSVGTNIVAKSTNGNGGYLNYSGLDSNGNTTFSVNHNGTVFAAGIDFGTFSSPVTSKTLGDYEEGTWTPVIKSGTNTISYSGGNQRFYYTKIGCLVTATFTLNGAVTSGTTGGGFKIEGLPFLSKNISNLRTIGTIFNYYGSGLRASAWPNFVHLDSNSTTIDIYTKTSTSGNYDRDTVGNVGSDTYVMWQITYETAA